jgi:hypothetical protein
VSDQLYSPAALPLGKGPQYPLDRRLGGPELVWSVWRKFLTLLGLKLNPSVVQLVANRYTASAIPASFKLLTLPESTHTPIQVSDIFEFQNIVAYPSNTTRKQWVLGLIDHFIGYCAYN